MAQFLLNLLQEEIKKTVATLFGQVVWLFTQSPKHKNFFPGNDSHYIRLECKSSFASGFPACSFSSLNYFHENFFTLQFKLIAR